MVLALANSPFPRLRIVSFKRHHVFLDSSCLPRNTVVMCAVAKFIEHRSETTITILGRTKLGVASYLNHLSRSNLCVCVLPPNIKDLVSSHATGVCTEHIPEVVNGAQISSSTQCIV